MKFEGILLSFLILSLIIIMNAFPVKSNAQSKGCTKWLGGEYLEINGQRFCDCSGGGGHECVCVISVPCDGPIR